MKDLYQDLFPPSSSNFYLWPTLELQALHPGAHGPGVISKVRTHPAPSWILHSQLSTPFLIRSLFQNYHLQLAISTMHLLLLNPSVYWNLWRPQTVIFIFIFCPTSFWRDWFTFLGIWDPLPVFSYFVEVALHAELLMYLWEKVISLSYSSFILGLPWKKYQT